MQPLRTIWNTACFAFIAFWAWVILPKVLGQFRPGNPNLPETFRQRVIMAGFEGIAVLVLYALAAVSLTTFFWKRVGWTVRSLYLLFGIAFVIGAIIARRIDLADLGTTIGSDRVGFLVSYAIVALPVIVFAVGWPRLLHDIIHRVWRKPPGTGQAP